jgi:hypothetical protein
MLACTGDATLFVTDPNAQVELLRVVFGATGDVQADRRSRSALAIRSHGRSAASVDAHRAMSAGWRSIIPA